MEFVFCLHLCWMTWQRPQVYPFRLFDVTKISRISFVKLGKANNTYTEKLRSDRQKEKELIILS